MTRALPPSASQTEMQDDGRLFAPSAARNLAPICDLLAEVAPARGRALELASGTGQQIVHFAQTCPRLIWVPTDIDAARLTSIRAYVGHAQLDNLAPPVALNAAQSGWSETTGPVDLIVLVNLIHLISTPEAQTLLKEAASALAPGGTFLLYGPFQRGGELTSEGDARFHQSLIEADPEIGYKDDFDLLDWAQDAGLEAMHVLEMPANNLAFVFGKPE